LAYIYATTYSDVADRLEFDSEESAVVNPEAAKNPSPIELNDMAEPKGHHEPKANKAWASSSGFKKESDVKHLRNSFSYEA
jgi:hypothetical protein